MLLLRTDIFPDVFWVNTETSDALKSIRHHPPTEVWGILPLTNPGDAIFLQIRLVPGHLYGSLILTIGYHGNVSQKNLNHLHKHKTQDWSSS